MGKQDRLIKRELGQATSKKQEEDFKVTFLKESQLYKIWGMDWYLDKAWEKIVFVLGFFAIIYSIVRILFRGLW